MDNETFKLSVQGLLDEAKTIRENKGKDYTKGNVDVFHNFKHQAEDIDISVLKVWYVYANKHYDAVVNYIKSGGQSESEPIRNRIIDLINYLVLLNGMLDEDKYSDESTIH